MRIESFAQEPSLLTLPPIVSGLRVRFAGSQRGGRVQIEFCNSRARAISGGDLDRPRAEAAVQRWLDANLPAWASGSEGSGSIWIDLTSGEVHLVPDAAG